MPELTADERATLLDLFDGLAARDVGYVVLRKWDRLPGYVRGDVDLLVERAGFDRFTALCTDLGFERPDGPGPTALLTAAIRNPRAALARGLALPRETIAGATGGSADGTVTVEEFRYGDLKVDAADGLAYPEGSGERAPPALERRLLARRRRQGPMYVPSEVDELAHVVTHCLFDYGGRVPDYYAGRCETLAASVAPDPVKRAEFAELVSLAVDGDADPVVDAVLDGEYDGVDDAPPLEPA